MSTHQIDRGFLTSEGLTLYAANVVMGEIERLRADLNISKIAHAREKAHSAELAARLYQDRPESDVGFPGLTWQEACSQGDEVIRGLRAELERERKKAAAMREALDELRIGVDIAVDENWGGPWPIPGCVTRMARANTALALDAGRDFISRERVRPLVEALDFLAQFNWDNLTPSIPEKLQSAIAHAKTLGFTGVAKFSLQPGGGL